jgi:hypothetical protein
MSLVPLLLLWGRGLEETVSQDLMSRGTQLPPGPCPIFISTWKSLLLLLLLWGRGLEETGVCGLEVQRCLVPSMPLLFFI